MEIKWLWLPLLMIIGMGFLYFEYQDDNKGNPMKFIRTLIATFLRILAAFFLGSFGFNIESFDPKEE